MLKYWYHSMVEQRWKPKTRQTFSTPGTVGTLFLCFLVTRTPSRIEQVAEGCETLPKKRWEETFQREPFNFNILYGKLQLSPVHILKVDEDRFFQKQFHSSSPDRQRCLSLLCLGGLHWVIEGQFCECTGPNKFFFFHPWPDNDIQWAACQFISRSERRRSRCVFSSHRVVAPFAWGVLWISSVQKLIWKF